MVSVVTGKDLKGVGAFSFVKVKGDAQGRLTIATTFAVLAVLVTNPEIVSGLLTDASINKPPL